MPERELTEEEIKKIGIISNRHSGEWDMDSNIHDTESDNVFTTYIFNLTDIDLFNMGDPSVEKNERKYNEKVVGEEKPDANNNFTNDF